MRKLNEFINEGGENKDLKSNHKNLKSNVPFRSLPKWFREAHTENANITYTTGKTGKMVWHNGTWLEGAWEGRGSIWEGGVWKDGNFWYGTWKDGTWEDGTFYYAKWLGGTWLGGRGKPENV